MLDPATWLAQAQRLPEGKSARVGHTCGPGSCMTITNKADGWHAYCFRCSPEEGSGWVGKTLSLAERIDRLRKQDEADAEAEDIDPPWPAVRDPADWPQHAAVWLYRAGLSSADIKRLGWFYHKRTDRVVLTVCDRSNGKLLYWQARGFRDSAPKYLNQAGADRATLVAEFGSGDTVVLTEDILSAWKVSVSSAVQAWSLLGIQLSDHILLRLMREAKQVVVWLDPDWNVPGRPGQRAAQKILKQLRAVGVPVRNICSRADPKLLSRKEIACLLTLPCCRS